jgi:predicted peroxiredoxin
MPQTLGICVAGEPHFRHVLGLTRAARAAGKGVQVFFTGDGVRLTQDPRFSELIGEARVSVCEVSYIAHGFQGKPVEGLVDKDFVTQGRNAEMVDECNRYVIL